MADLHWSSRVLFLCSGGGGVGGLWCSISGGFLKAKIYCLDHGDFAIQSGKFKPCLQLAVILGASWVGPGTSGAW